LISSGANDRHGLFPNGTLGVSGDAPACDPFVDDVAFDEPGGVQAASTQHGNSIAIHIDRLGIFRLPVFIDSASGRFIIRLRGGMDPRSPVEPDASRRTSHSGHALRADYSLAAMTRAAGSSSSL
jgi:hypothetical protein